MSTGTRLVGVYFLFCGVVIFAGLMFFAPLPTWLWGVLAIPLIFFAARTWRPHAAPDPRPDPDPFAPEPIPEPRDHRLEKVPLPSQKEGYEFEFSATVRWVALNAGQTRTASAQGSATKAVLERAMAITRTWSPEGYVLLGHELAAALGSMVQSGPGYANAWAEQVEVTLRPDDRDRLNRLADLRKDETLWELERLRERNQRRYLGDDVLKDPGSAVVWWLSKNSEQVRNAVDHIPLLTELSDAANNIAPANGHEPWPAPPDGRTPSSSADVFESFLLCMGMAEGDEQRALFAAQVADLVAEHGRKDIATELTDRFDPDPGEGAPA